MMVGMYLGIGLTSLLTGLCVDNVILYIIAKFLLGLFFGGALLCIFVMQIELYAAKYRMWAGRGTRNCAVCGYVVHIFACNWVGGDYLKV